MSATEPTLPGRLRKIDRRHNLPPCRQGALALRGLGLPPKAGALPSIFMASSNAKNDSPLFCIDSPAAHLQRRQGHRPSLLHVSYVVDTDYILRCVPDRLVTCDVRLTENVHLSVEWFILFDGFDRLAFGVENGSDRSRAVVLLNVSGNANVLPAVLHKYGGRTLSFLNHFIDQIEIVVYLCRTKIDCRNLLASHSIGPIDLR